MLEGIIPYLKGYRTCYDCGEKALKREMTFGEVRDGLLDSKYVWRHGANNKNCSPNPYHHIRGMRDGPFG